MHSNERILPLRLRDAAAVALAVISGATDAIGFLALGGAFTSVMTGNMVLLGTSMARNDGALAGHIAVAIVSYMTGCGLGARIAGTTGAEDPIWPPAVTRALKIEATMFVVYAAGWWATDGRPGGGTGLSLLAISAVALGLQSATVQRFGVAGLSTTYLTGTLTTLVIRLVTGYRFREVAHHLLQLAGLIVGAAVAALLTHDVPALAPLTQLVSLGIVLGIAGWQGHARRAARTGAESGSGSAGR